MYTNADDYADNSATTGLLSVGSQTMGNLELAQDTDWFKIQLQAGTTYVFELSGAASGSGTLSRPYLHLYDSSNYHFSVRSGYNGGTNGDPLFSYTPTTSGDYYLGASDFYDTGTGTYTLKATSAGTSADDYVDNSTTTGLLSVSSQTMGNLELAQDADWFKIQLQAGTTYVFELNGAASGSGTLSRPYLHLYDSSNYHFSVRSGYNGGTNGDPLFSYTPTTSGDYYLGASDFYDTGTGTYTLKATSESVTSSDTALVTNSNHLPTGNIVIKGAAKVEQILSLTSTLEDADGLGDFSYQWLSNGKEIKNAIQDTYKLLKSDIGSKISVNVSYTDGEGTDELVTSVATAKVVTNISAKPSKGNDQLVGTAKNNKLSSLAGDDTLIGGQGADTLTGGKGADTFIFTAESESWITSTTRETITDFKHSEKDKIDLSAIDANAKLAGDQAFTFIGSAAFSKANSSGQLRFDATSHILYGSTNADNKPEFSIQLNGVNSLVAGDFIL